MTTKQTRRNIWKKNRKTTSTTTTQENRWTCVSNEVASHEAFVGRLACKWNQVMETYVVKVVCFVDTRVISFDHVYTRKYVGMSLFRPWLTVCKYLRHVLHTICNERTNKQQQQQKNDQFKFVMSRSCFETFWCYQHHPSYRMNVRTLFQIRFLDSIEMIP